MTPTKVSGVTNDVRRYPERRKRVFRCEHFHISLHQRTKFGQACTDLIVRAGIGDIVAHTSTHAMSEVSHRLMTIEPIIT